MTGGVRGGIAYRLRASRDTTSSTLSPKLPVAQLAHPSALGRVPRGAASPRCRGQGLPRSAAATVGKSPFSDNFASNNDADGNHLNEDKSFAVSISGVRFESCPAFILAVGFFHPHRLAFRSRESELHRPEKHPNVSWD